MTDRTPPNSRNQASSPAAARSTPVGAYTVAASRTAPVATIDTIAKMLRAVTSSAASRATPAPSTTRC